MLKLAKDKKAVHDWSDMNDWVCRAEIQYGRQFPCFDGDFWPDKMESFITQIQDDNAAASGAADGKGGAAGKKGKKGGANKKGAKKKGGGKKSKKARVTAIEEELAEKVVEEMEKHKDVFFVVQLQADVDRKETIKDPDGEMTCELMDGRDTFLSLCRENHHEFSTLRRSKYSSMILL